MRTSQPSVRALLRVIVTVVLSALALYVVYIVREPLGWLVLATFLAIAASGPVNFLARQHAARPRGGDRLPRRSS